MIFSGEWAIKFALQTANQYTVPKLLRLAQLGYSEGFKQVWINDNLCQRNIFVVLAAMAAKVPIKFGTSIITPYLRNPVDLADSLAAMAELADGREFSVGIARGDISVAGQQIEMPHPIPMVRETTLAISALLSGQPVFFRDYPAAAAYYRIRPQQEFRLAFSPPPTVRFYSGGNAPQIMRIAGRIMDGALIGNHYIPLVRSGHLNALLEIERQSAKVSQPGKRLFDIGEVDISVCRDEQRALEFARPYAARILMALEHMGLTHDEIRRLGIEPELATTLKRAVGDGASWREASMQLSNHAIRSCFVAGTPEQCRDQLAPLLLAAEKHQLGQISFTKLGPDYEESIELLSRQVLKD